jgi:hypothetical protein
MLIVYRLGLCCSDEATLEGTHTHHLVGAYERVFNDSMHGFAVTGVAFPISYARHCRRYGATVYLLYSIRRLSNADTALLFGLFLLFGLLSFGLLWCVETEFWHALSTETQVRLSELCHSIDPRITHYAHSFGVQTLLDRVWSSD